MPDDTGHLNLDRYAQINTPWGLAGELRARKLSPGPGKAAEDVARNQRERLFGATVAVVSELGYETTRVADILTLAGVSRSAFYRHFDDKRTCFLATLDAIIEATGQEAARGYRRTDAPWDERLRAVFETTVKMILAQPAAARVWFIETYSAGSDAVGRIERLRDQLQRLAIETLAESPERTDMPPQVARAIVGGLGHVIQTHLRQGREHELPALVPDLLDWAIGYHAPPERLRRPRKAPPIELSSPDPSEQRARILVAATELAAEKGHQSMTVTEVAQRAAISLSTFYNHFDNKADVFLAAIDDGERRLLEATMPAYGSAPDWPHAIKDGLHAFFAFLTTNPATARLGGLDIFSGGAAALQRHEKSVRGFEALLEPGYETHPDTNPVASEAIAGAIVALIYQQLRIKGPEGLYQVAPTATFLALAPFAGADRACSIANEGWRPARAA